MRLTHQLQLVDFKITVNNDDFPIFLKALRRYEMKKKLEKEKKLAKKAKKEKKKKKKKDRKRSRYISAKASYLYNIILSGLVREGVKTEEMLPRSSLEETR